MGEVYRAKDTRLDRTVAIKVLPDHLTKNPEMQQRFEREARAVSSLSHSNISYSALVVQEASGKSQPAAAVSRNGDKMAKELFYVSPDKQIVSVSINDETAFEAGIPVKLFEVFIPTSDLSGNRNYYLVADNGKKFWVCSFVSKEKARPITVVSNWPAAIKNK